MLRFLYSEQKKTYVVYADSSATMPSKKWTRSTIKAAILARYHDSKMMDQEAVRRDDGGLLNAAKKVFHGWYPALDACGIPSAGYRKQKSWNKDNIISTLQKWHHQGINIRPHALHKTAHGILDAGTRIFGSPRAMYEAAGINPAEIGLPQSWGKETIRQALLKRQASGKSMKYPDVRKEDPTLMAACESPWHYGGYYKALGECGIPVEEIRTLLPKGHWTSDRTIAEIHALVRKKEPVNDRHVQMNYGPLYSAAQKVFGSWGSAISAAGYDYDSLRSQRKPYTRDELRDTLRTLMEQGVPLDYTSIKSYYPGLADGIIRIFGSFQGGIEAIGLDYDDVKRTWQFDKIRGEIFEDYVDQVLKIVEWKVETHRQFKFGDCKCVPDFYDVDSGDWIDAKLKSWTPNVQAKVDKYLEHADHVTLIYLYESRTKLEFWDPLRVTPISITRFYSELRKRGAHRLVEDIELLRRGVIFKPEFQTRLRDFVNRKYPMKAAEVIRLIESIPEKEG